MDAGGGSGGSGGWPKWLRFNDRSISLNPLMPSRLYRLFLPFCEACIDSSEGSVTVLLVASPHLHCRLTSASSWINTSSGRVPSVLLRMSRRRTSWRWLRSCRPVDVRHGKLDDPAGPDALSAGGDFDSSPDRVTARSRLFRRSSSACRVGVEILEDGGEAGEGVPPPSSISSSAHSQGILYLIVIAFSAATNCVCSEKLDLGSVLERSREWGRARWMIGGDVARDRGALSSTACTSATRWW